MKYSILLLIGMLVILVDRDLFSMASCLPHLIIDNETAWPVSAVWQVPSKSVMGSSQAKVYNTVVNAADQEVLGVLTEIEDLKVCTYGALWSKIFSAAHHIIIATLQQDTSQDGYVIIEESAWTKSWRFACVSKPLMSQLPKALPGDIRLLLPGVLRARAAGSAIRAHHILNIDPALVSDDIIENSYKRLVDRWKLQNPMIGPFERKLMCLLQEALHALRQKEDRVFVLEDY